MDAYPLELVSALLKWVQTFEYGKSVKSWSNFRDGEVLWKILQDIDPDYFSGSLPEEGHRTGKDYVLRLQNIKHIERNVARYIRQELDRLPNTVNKLCPALDGIAGDNTAQEAPKLVMTILLCAMYSPKSNTRMIVRVQSLGNEAGLAIATKIREIEDIDQKMGDYYAETNNGIDHDAFSTSETLHTSRGPSSEVDMELQKEEKLIQAYKLIDELQDKNTAIGTDLQNARKTNATLEEELAEHRVLDQGNLRNTEELKYLTSQTAKDKNYIASLESELQTSQADLETKTRQLDLLKSKSASAAELQDQLQLIKAERDELIQHKNANENLKKKVQSLQEQARSDEFLKQDLQSAREQLQEFDKLKDDRDALLKANEEKSKVIANCEQEIFDSKSTKKRLETDIKAALQRYESMKERQQRDHETIQELQEQLEVGQGNVSQSVGNLDAELAAGEEMSDALVRYEFTNTLLRAAMLITARRAKVVETKTPIGGSAEVELLRQRLSAVESRNSVLENNYLDVYQDKLGLETTLNDLKDRSKTETSHPFLHQREKLQAVEKENEDRQAEIFKLQAELAQIKATQDLNLSKEDEYKKLSVDIEEQRVQNTSLNTKLDEKEALLQTALLNAQAHQRKTDAEEKDYQFILAQLQAARSALADSPILEGTATKLAERLEEGREMVSEATKVNNDISASELKDKHLYALFNAPRNPWAEHAPSGPLPMPAIPQPAWKGWFGGGARAGARPVSALAPIAKPMWTRERMSYGVLERAEASEDRIRALQLEMEEARKSGGDQASRDELENLQRENALMTTAWYDLSSRLQMNTMALQRRNEQPRSWLGKQRVLVNKSQTRR